LLVREALLFLHSDEPCLVAVLPLNGLQCLLLLLRIHRFVRLPQLLISVCKVTLVSERTILVSFVVSAPFGFIFVIKFRVGVITSRRGTVKLFHSVLLIIKLLHLVHSRHSLILHVHKVLRHLILRRLVHILVHI